MAPLEEADRFAKILLAERVLTAAHKLHEDKIRVGILRLGRKGRGRRLRFHAGERALGSGRVVLIGATAAAEQGKGSHAAHQRGAQQERMAAFHRRVTAFHLGLDPFV